MFALISIFFSYPTLILKLNLQINQKNKLNIKKLEHFNLKQQNKWQKSMKLLKRWMKRVSQHPDMETVIEILTELRNDQEILKVMIRSVVWNSWGYVYFTEGKYDEAIRSL